jgi:hypothetical protein
MMATGALLHLGDPWLTLAAGAAIAAWLAAARAWRMAACWSVLFALGIGLVGATKVAFLASGTSLAGLDFRSLSGHAAGVTAVAPMLGYLLLRQRGRRSGAAAIGAGLGLGALMGMLLVVHGEHSAAEAVAGWTIGAAVSIGAIALAGTVAPRQTLRAALYFAVVFAAAAWQLRTFPFGYLMYRTAAWLAANWAALSWDTA